MTRVVSILVLLLAACGPVEITEPSAQPVAMDPPNPFAELTLAERAEWHFFHDDAGRPTRFQRWEAPIRAAIYAPDEWLDAVDVHFRRLSELSGLEIEVSHFDPPNGEPPQDPPRRFNFALRLGTAPALHPYAVVFAQQTGAATPLPDRFGCFFWTDLENISAPKAAIIIPAVSDADVVTCLLQETTQALGLIGDLDGRFDTVFSSQSTRQSFSQTDERLIELFYDARLVAGMSRQEASPIIQQIVAERGW